MKLKYDIIGDNGIKALKHNALIFDNNFIVTDLKKDSHKYKKRFKRFKSELEISFDDDYLDLINLSLYDFSKNNEYIDIDCSEFVFKSDIMKKQVKKIMNLFRKYKIDEFTFSCDEETNDERALVIKELYEYGYTIDRIVERVNLKNEKHYAFLLKYVGSDK